MGENKYSPEEIITAAPVLNENSKCFYCLDSIVFADIEYFDVRIPSSSENIALHILCLEEFAWSLFNYFFAYIQNRKLVKKAKTN